MRPRILKCNILFVHIQDKRDVKLDLYTSSVHCLEYLRRQVYLKTGELKRQKWGTH